MRRLWKRVLALVCAVTMVLGSGLAESAQMVNASDETVKVKSLAGGWWMFSSEKGTEIASGGSIYKQIADAGTVVSGSVTTENLALYMKVYLADEAAVNVMQKTYVELSQEQTGHDSNEYQWSINALGLEFTTGMNEIQLNLSKNHGTPSTFDLTSEINWFRIYEESSETSGSVLLYEVKLIDLQSEDRTKFGQTDTYLQTSEMITGTPDTIEASVKVDAIQDEWIIRPASKFGTTSLTTTADEPGEGIAYATKTSLDYWYNFTSITIPRVYSKGNLALSFWVYSSTGEGYKDGQLELTSGGTCDKEELSWTMSGLITKQGWNYVELNLADGKSTGGDIDLASLNFSRIYGTEPTDTEFRITDIKLIVRTDWTLRSADSSTFSYGLTPTIGKIAEGDVTNGVGPEVGTTYAEVQVKAYDTEDSNSGRFGFNNTLFTPVSIPDVYDANDLAVSFWFYSSVAIRLPVGRIQVGNRTTSGTVHSRWSTYIQMNEGWNYVELKFSKANEKNVGGNVDFSALNYIYWYSDSGSANLQYLISQDTTFRITDAKIIVLDNNTTTSSYSITTTENVDATTFDSNYMIYSNTNGEDSTNPYALYITPKGYPALLWGTTQFCLNYNVRCGSWVKIKAVRNSEGKIEFYINDKLMATSTTVATEMEVINEIYSIGADGAGGQVFEGNIADVRVCSDSSGTTCMGYWQLIGDIQDVLETLPDVSGNNNSLVYKGSRAADWIDYDISKYDFLWKDANDNNVYDEGEEDYWSMVFIPDIQNLTTGKFTDTWLTMSDWIAENIETEKIKHVIGAGDTTWNNLESQYNRAMEGFNKFIYDVSWSNMVGNHDYVWSATYRDSDMYQKYFGEELLQNSGSKDTYVGCYNDTPNAEGHKTTVENSYYRFSVNGVKWMILQLEYHPRTMVLEWAQDILEQYPNDNVILTTHGYIGGTGGYIGEGMTYIDANETGYLGTSTEVIWKDYLQGYSNIKYILCGHSANGTGAIATKEETNSNGDKVMALMVNAQDMDMGDNEAPGYYTNKALGMLGIFRFSKDGSQVALQWYAPQYDKSFSPEDPSGNRDSNNITLSYETETCTPEVVPYTEGFEAGKEPTDMADYNAKGYVFAGWFTNEECTKALTKDNQANVTQAYAKYVDAEILSVKAQVSGNLYDTNTENDGTGAIRFVTTIDSRKYQKVGFVLKVKDGAKEATVGSDEIYEVLYAVNETSKEAELIDYRPDRFSPESEFFKTFTLTGFTDSDTATFNFDTQITATPYWITQDGTTVYGTAATKSINMGLGN